MPSSQQPQPVTAKPRGTYLRKKIAEFGFSPSTKSSGAKSGLIINTKNRDEQQENDCTSHNKSNSDNSNSKNNDNLNSNSEDNVKKNYENNPNYNEVINNIISRPNNNIGLINSNNNNNAGSINVNSDGNNNNVSFEPAHLSGDQQILANHNSSFNSAAARMMNECATSSGESSLMTSSSSSSHRQQLHRQITKTSEMKTSCVKSDLSELKSSLSEMKNLNFANSKFKKPFENMLDPNGEDTISNNVNATAEPLITYPESPTPSNPNGNIILFQSGDDVINSRKNSIATNDDVSSNNSSTSLASELKFQQRRISSASKTQLITEKFKAEESSCNEMGCKRLQASALQTKLNNVIAEKSLDARNGQRTLTSEDVKQQQSQNVSSSSVRLQTDSFSSEKMQKATAGQQQMQTITASGVFNGEKRFLHHSSSNFTTTSVNSVSQVQQYSNNSFIQNEISEAGQSTVSNYLSEQFEDLKMLIEKASQEDVQKAITKYSKCLREIVTALKDTGIKSKTYDVPDVLNKLSEMMSNAWLVPTHGHELGNSLCDVLRQCGGLDLLLSKCDPEGDNDVQFSSAKLLEQCLTTDNRTYVVNNGLDKVVKVACVCGKRTGLPDYSRVSTGILEHLFKHSEGTCESVIKLGGLDAILFQCRQNDVDTLRHCASALVNLSLYGGADNQEAMIKRQAPVWLFPLAFHNDDNIKYYACLAIAVLVANKEIEAAVLRSGTLDLVEPFVTSHDPSAFAKSNLAYAHGQSQNWLQKLVPVLSSKREEARSLAAFHFCMEAGIKKTQGNTKVFADIKVIECLKRVASCPNAIASKYAAQALRLIGEAVPHKLIQQVPLWSVEDVKQWVIQIGFAEYSNNFEESKVDGDLLLQLTEENLKDDIGIINGIRRRRFTRELQNLKKMADYTSRDTNKLNHFLQTIGAEFTVYTYSMLNAGVDKDSIRCLSEDQLLNECGIVNSIHRLRILESVKIDSLPDTFQQDSEKPLDVFISYRRSNGSQLASLLKVHLQVRNFTVFIDVEKLEAGKFDNNLLQSIKQARNFLLVLSPNALDRCMEDRECKEPKDWVHREIVAALQSQCNIIPITADNFEWPEPEQLPEDMNAICKFNGIRWIHDYQDACVEKLERFIKGEVNSKNSVQEGFTGGLQGSRLPKNEVSPSTNIKSSYQRATSSESNKGSDGGS